MKKIVGTFCSKAIIMRHPIFPMQEVFIGVLKKFYYLRSVLSVKNFVLHICQNEATR